MIINPQRFIALKAKIKAECQRRQYRGSVAEYGSATYDYDVAPEDGKIVSEEHIEKLAIPMNAINSTDTPFTDGERVADEEEFAKLEAKVDEYASISRTSSKHGCSASCTGLCSGYCSGGCSGCGGCGSNCTGGCSNACKSCTGSCSAVCASGCGHDMS